MAFQTSYVTALSLAGAVSSLQIIQQDQPFPEMKFSAISVGPKPDNLKGPWSDACDKYEKICGAVTCGFCADWATSNTCGVGMGVISNSCDYSNHCGGTCSEETCCEAIVSGSGDPHMVNVLGEQFDLWRLGEVELLRIPRNSSQSAALLQFVATVSDYGHYSGNVCAEAPYMTEMRLRLRQDDLFINMVEGKMSVSLNGNQLTPSFKSLPIGALWSQATSDTSVLMPSSSHVKVTIGNATIDVSQDPHPVPFFLNMVAKRLDSLGFKIGGVLGLDDHSAVAKKPAHCPEMLSQSVKSTGDGAHFRMAASLHD